MPRIPLIIILIKLTKVSQRIFSLAFDINSFVLVPYSHTNIYECNKNINTWYTSKKTTGFIIRSEVKMSGSIDWIATKLKFEGDA